VLGGLRQPPALEIARHDDDPAGRALRTALGDQAGQLQPLFSTDVRRTHRMLSRQGARVELALDLGRIDGGDRHETIRELEFELKGGTIGGLITMARGWVHRHGLWLDVRSKAERGHLLAHHMAVASATRAKPPRVNGDVTADRALRLVVEAGLDHLLPNAAALAAGLADDEHRAQARRGLASLQEALARSSAQDPAASVQAWALSLAELVRQVDGEAAGVIQAGGPLAWQARAGAALRSPAAGLLWLDLLGYALVDRPD
jgi:inorganic triphosphatase YgiF